MSTYRRNNWASENLLADTDPIHEPVSTSRDSVETLRQQSASQEPLAQQAKDPSHDDRELPPRYVSIPPPAVPVAAPVPVPTFEGSRMMIAVDFGTTHTGLAFARTQSDEVQLSVIEVQHDWTAKMSNQPKVRSVISYGRPAQGEAQWGSDVSPDSTIMVNTKLELEPNHVRYDELDLTLQTLREMGNLSFDHIRRASSDPEYTSSLLPSVLTRRIAHGRSGEPGFSLRNPRLRQDADVGDHCLIGPECFFGSQRHCRVGPVVSNFTGDIHSANVETSSHPHIEAQWR